MYTDTHGFCCFFLSLYFFLSFWSNLYGRGRGVLGCRQIISYFLYFCFEKIPLETFKLKLLLKILLKCQNSGSMHSVAAPKGAVSWQNQENDCASSKDSDQPWHPPSLIRVFAVRMKKAWVLSYPLSTQQRLWSDWTDAQADLSLRWAQSHFVGFVMRRLKCISVSIFYQ